MNFLKERVFSVALLLALTAAMPSVINAQSPMTEIPLASGSGAQSVNMSPRQMTNRP